MAIEFKLQQFSNNLEQVVGEEGNEDTSNYGPTPTDYSDTQSKVETLSKVLTPTNGAPSPKSTVSPLSSRRLDPTYRSPKMDRAADKVLELSNTILSVYWEIYSYDYKAAFKSQLNQALGNVVEYQQKIMKDGLKTPITIDAQYFSIVITAKNRSFIIPKALDANKRFTTELDYNNSIKVVNNSYGVLSFKKASDEKISLLKGILQN